eukprot:c8811_g1_i1.p1 GENE.c8811_g1_i1~~c8811_g1_i1.p1  ORF type:complete len:813 (+),score=290.44 c8811_g1_i1:90-2441(+)
MTLTEVESKHDTTEKKKKKESKSRKADASVASSTPLSPLGTRKSPRLHPEQQNLVVDTIELGPTTKKSKKRDASEATVDAASSSTTKDKEKKSSKKRKLENGDAVTGDDGVLEVVVAEGEPKLAEVSKFRVCQHTRKLLELRKIKTLFPIQSSTFDWIYDGKDVLGRARTGTGKTLAFSLPIVERFKQQIVDKQRVLKPRRLPAVLVMTPTRELAKQIAFEIEAITGKDFSSPSLSIVTVYGGSQYYPQEKALREGVDFVVGTPGRIIDHIDRGTLQLSGIEVVILDEADQMLNVGFADDIEKIMSKIAHTRKVQLLLFSATLPAWVTQLTDKYLAKDKKTVNLIEGNAGKTSELITHLAIMCPWQQRVAVLADLLKVYAEPDSKSIVFADTKKDCNEIGCGSELRGCQVLHGDISQQQREITLTGFRQGRFNCLVATDVAARGLDIENVDLVVQCHPPSNTETYIHRAGRTGRAGKKGTCVVFYSPYEATILKIIERKTGCRFQRISAPQPADIVRSSVKSTVRRLAQVHDDVSRYFEEAAKELVETHDVVRTLASALAFISGHTEPPKSRSLLNSTEGFVTIMFEADYEVRSPTHVWGHITRLFGESLAGRVRGMKLAGDNRCAVFDVPAEHVEAITNTPMEPRTTCGYEVRVATILPDFEAPAGPLGPSLFTNDPASCTVAAYCDRGIRAKSFVAILMTRYFSDEFSNSVTNLQLQRDGVSAVFDVPLELAKEVASMQFPDPSTRFEIATALPHEFSRGASSSGGFGRGGGGRSFGARRQ